VDGAPDVEKAAQHYFNARLSARYLAPFMARITQKTLPTSLLLLRSHISGVA
jgi:hypothetical protein